MAAVGFFQKLLELLRLRNGSGAGASAVSDKGFLVFASTSEVIAAEQWLRKQGFDVEVKGPPPDLQTGCDMVVVFTLVQQAAIENALAKKSLTPEKIITAADALLDPVSLYQVKDLGKWLMARAANMKITVDKTTQTIVNISGGGCPDVPWLAQKLTGEKLFEAPEPLSLGHTLCCYSLQKAFAELKRVLPCG